MSHASTHAKRWYNAARHLNFYRIHLLVFTFTPLFFSIIFYAVNGRFRISYVDSLFVCVSAMTVTGLATIDLSQLTGLQQAILYVQLSLGSIVAVSWVMVYIRRYFFEKKFEHIIEAEIVRQSASTTPVGTSAAPSVNSVQGRLAQLVLMRSRKDKRGRKSKLSTLSEHSTKPNSPNGEREDEPVSAGKLRIRRTDEAPRLINPQGWISDEPPTDSQGQNGIPLVEKKEQQGFAPITDSPRPVNIELPPDSPEDETYRRNEPDVQSVQSDVRSTFEYPRPRFAQDVDTQLRPYATRTSARREPIFPRTQTVEFAPQPHKRHGHPGMHARQNSAQYSHRESMNLPRARTIESRNMPHTTSLARTTSVQPSHDIGFGGFPWPNELAARLLRRMFPKLGRRLKRSLTVPQTTTFMSARSTMGGARPSLEPHGPKPVPYLTFDAVVGRNSAFNYLSSEQLEELGGVEYRALKMLQWVIGSYHILSQLISCLVIAPYISQSKWRDAFHPPALHRYVNPVWFTVFQVMSAYTNAGISLVDQSMVPFQKAYPMILFMCFLILAGNTAFPVFLRFIIWILYKIVPRKSTHSETLCFLLDHPRRCFVYLFPSHQTWFLLTVLVILNFTDWFFFLVLDIGNPEIEQVPLGTRFVIGLLQAFAVRAAGFATISIAALAPAVKVLYVTMMYISVYPIALSVRTTNVYEERSLGVYDTEEGHDGESQSQSEEPSGDGSRGAVWGRYLAWHARKQLAFDMWWLGLALFLICIVERSNIQNPHNEAWFNIFSIVFELVSAYGTVGLSLGTPNANFSFSGEFRPLSKLIICLVMIRGRHRGLPVAIDRAVLLPSEFKKMGPQPMDDKRTDPQPLDDEEYVVVGDRDGENSSRRFERSSSPPPRRRKATV
ncbi:hypothetical protein AURDEDRAFT_113542 [Auricularia subglabra TFB-10046 SS5]|nr:hypothetical protein AURDEDRAFT_113542 [Auricularia subglabra TFB-10046 SS5]